MKRITQLFNEILRIMGYTLYSPANETKKKPQPAELEKAWYNYLKDKDSKMTESEKQRKLLYQYMLYHRENNLN